MKVVSDLSVLSTGKTEEAVNWLKVSNGNVGGGDWDGIEGGEDRSGYVGGEACTIKDESFDFAIID